MGGISTMEGYMLAFGKEGSTFYSEKMDRHLTSMANQRGRKITTERLIVIQTGGKKLNAHHVTKVTICQ